MAAKANGTAPEVRQCTDPDDPEFGATATWSDEANMWFVGRVSGPARGGHWQADPEFVKDWTVRK